MIIILAIFLFNFYSFIFASVSSNSEHLKQQNSLNNLNGGKINGERSGGGVCLGFTDVFIAFVLIILILATVLGNILVVLSVCLYKRMRTFTNLLLTSLATADLLVGLLIMPLALLDLLHAHSWPLGIVTCRIWATFDILLCTASILNLCIISLDRYMAITSPLRYPRTRSRWMAFALLCFVWGMSLVVCSPPWFIDEWSISFDSKSSVIFIPPKRTKTRSLSEGIGVENINTAHVISGYQCAYPMSVSYRIYSASCSFYIPLMVMLFVYFKIFRVASERERLIREGMGTCRLSRRVEKTQMKGRKRSATTNYTHRSSVPRIRGGIAQPTTKTVFPGQAKEQQNMLNHCSPVTLANINNININNNHIIPTNRPVSSCEHFYLNQEERRSSSAGQNLLNNENTTEGGDGGDKLSSCCSAETSCPTSARNSGKGLTSNSGPINRTVAAAVDRAKGSGGSDSFRRKIKSMECLGSGQYDTFGIEGSRKSSKYRKNSADPPVDDNSPERRDSLQQNLHPPDRLILANGARQPLRQQNSYGVNMKTDTLIGHTPQVVPHFTTKNANLRGSKEKIVYLRERKALKTIGIVVLGFILCWCPFFVVYILEVSPLQKRSKLFSRHEFQVLAEFFLWLGYSNSVLNPIIYTMYNSDFRRCFRDLLGFGCFQQHRRTMSVKKLHQQSTVF
uniref:G-protein coupled receptors family 1 profile domain-containing protein n=1 Tax=Meloidogyne enterolobii TaxID=390850 RepID=A0A6V7VC05_MELEN|nr:unnamed protein product [Meloidogyne enterolobii]